MKGEKETESYKRQRQILVAPKYYNLRKYNNFRKSSTYNFYKPALIALAFCGIDMFPKSHNSFMCVRKTMVIMNLILTVVSILVAVKNIASTKTDFALFCIISTGIIFTRMLYGKRKEIFDLLMLLQKIEYMKCDSHLFKNRKKLLFSLGGIFITLTVWCIITAVHSRGYKDNQFVNSVLDKLKIRLSDKCLYVESILEFAVPYVCTVYPLSIFFLLYSFLALHIKIIMECFRNQIVKSSCFKDIFTEYNNICNLIEIADKILSSLVLTAILYASCILYYSIFLLIKSERSISFFTLLDAVPLLCVLLHLLKMIDSAAGIPDINAQIHKLILNLPHVPSSSADKLFLVLKTQKELGLSVGGLATVKRGLFLTLVGTIFTYLLLIRSVEG